MVESQSPKLKHPQSDSVGAEEEEVSAEIVELREQISFEVTVIEPVQSSEEGSTNLCWLTVASVAVITKAQKTKLLLSLISSISELTFFGCRYPQ